jgi:hypothetical protein
VNGVTFADLVAHALSRGFEQAYVEEQLDQGWLPSGERVGREGGRSHQEYPASIYRALDVLVDAKETQKLRGDGLRFWLWLYGARQFDDVAGGVVVGDSVRAVAGTTLKFVLKHQLPKLVAFNPGGRPRKDGRLSGIVNDDAAISYDKRIDRRKAENLESLMNDIGYQSLDVIEPLVWRIAGIPIDPAVNRKAVKLYLANAAGVPPEYMGIEPSFTANERKGFGDASVLTRLQKGEPGNWNVDKIVARATSDDWEETRRYFFTPAGLLYVSFTEAIIEQSPPRPSLRKQYEFFRHPQLTLRAMAIGVDVCDKVNQRNNAERQMKKHQKGETQDAAS